MGESGGGHLYATATRHLPPNGKSLEITVIGRQFIWQFVYPGANEADGLGAPYSYEELVVPTKTTVTLDIVSADVVHSWWVPQLGGKFQAVPGYHNYTWFKIDKPGVYRGQCALICGRGHARMIATVKAVPPAQFEAWLAYQKQLIAEANADAAAIAREARLPGRRRAGREPQIDRNEPHRHPNRNPQMPTPNIQSQNPAHIEQTRPTPERRPRRTSPDGHRRSHQSPR